MGPTTAPAIQALDEELVWEVWAVAVEASAAMVEVEMEVWGAGDVEGLADAAGLAEVVKVVVVEERGDMVVRTETVVAVDRVGSVSD